MDNEKLEILKKYQTEGKFHPLTCCSFEDCVRSEENDWGVLIPMKDKWVCKCGKYTQEYNGSEVRILKVMKEDNK